MKKNAVYIITGSKTLNKKRNFSYLLLAVLLINIFSCKNKQQETIETTDDSLHVALDIVDEDSMLIFENNADKWLDLSLRNNETNWKRFKLKEFWYEDSLEKESFTPGKDFYKDYYSLLKWSPDSSYILDIGTYSKVLVKDKNGTNKIEDGEVDTKASLIFPKENLYSKLIFLGASGNFIDGRWIDSTQFSILGVFDEKGNQKPDTLLWLVDAKEKFFRKYKLE